MKTIFILAIFQVFTHEISAQSNTENIISGGKAVIELITLLQKNKTSATNNFKEKAAMPDSCAVKQRADLCFSNATSRELTISICKRNDSAYEPTVFTVKVLRKKKECLFELRSGIYKYRIEADEGNTKILFSEGEFRLYPCDNMLREIKE